MVEPAPSWFTDFFTEYRRDKADLAVKNADTAESLREITSRVTSIEKQLTKQVAKYRTEIATLRSEIASISQRHLLEDPCEIQIVGIPSALRLEMRQAADRIFTALGYSKLGNLIIETRIWTQIDPNSNGSFGSCDAATSAFVVKLISSTLRNSILSKVSGLRNHDDQSLFGIGGNLSSHR